jgi:zinc protease
VFDDTLSAALASNNPRLMRSVARFLESGSLTTAVDFWKERASNGAGFIVVITGDFTLDKMRPLVERYLGSIPSGAPEQPRDVGIPLVSGVVRREVDSGVSGTARAAIAMTGPLPTTHQAFERLELVRDLMQAAIEHRLRDELGGTYGVSVSLATSLAPPARYTMTVDFRAAAEHVEELAAAALREIERLRVNGPTEAEFDRARAARLQDYDGEIEDNDYWISELSSHARFGWPFGEIAEHPREVANLTLADLRGACASYISRGSYVRVTTRPHARATIAPPP